MKLTQANIGKLRPPSDKADCWIPDDKLGGFGIRFRNGGEGVYGVRYSIGGRDRRLSYAPVTKVTLADARAWAKQQHATIANREDPAALRAKAVAEVSASIEPQIKPFIEHLQANGKAASYIQENKRSLYEYFKNLHRYGPDDITRKMIAEEVSRIRRERGPVAGDRSLSHLSGFFGWLIGEGLAENNPVQGVNRTKSKPREKLLRDDEVVRIWNAGDGHGDYGDVVRLLILSGCRRDEIASLRWSEINLPAKQIELPGDRTKNGLAHVVPLSSLAFSILSARRPRPNSDYLFGVGGAGFSGFSRAKAALDAKSGVRGWVLHDFRRYISTTMHERLNIPPHSRKD